MVPVSMLKKMKKFSCPSIFICSRRVRLAHRHQVESLVPGYDTGRFFGGFFQDRRNFRHGSTVPAPSVMFTLVAFQFSLHFIDRLIEGGSQFIRTFFRAKKCTLAPAQ